MTRAAKQAGQREAAALSRAEFLTGVATGAVAAGAALPLRALGTDAGEDGTVREPMTGNEAAWPASDKDDGAGVPAGSTAGDASTGAASTRPALTIWQVTDSHFISPRLTDHGAAFERTITTSDAKCMEYSEQIVDALVWDALRERPDAVVLTGDLTYNGARESHEDMAAKLRQIADAGIPVLAMPGNHDLNYPYAARFEGDTAESVASVSADEFAQLYAPFGYDGALARDEASLSYAWEVPASSLPSGSVPLRLLLVDCNGVETPGTLPAETLAWVAAQLDDARAAGARVLAFSHQSVLQQAFIAAGFSIGNADDLARLYLEAGVPANFSGHLHCQHFAQATSAGDLIMAADEAAGAAPALTDVATSALCVAPIQHGVVTLDAAALAGRAGTLSYRTRTLDVSGWARATGQTNADLLDFGAYAEDFFHQASHPGLARQLAEEDLDDDDRAELATYLTDMNLAWFKGRLDIFERRPELDAQLIQASPLSGAYLSYIFDQDVVRDENAFDLTLGPLE